MVGFVGGLGEGCVLGKGCALGPRCGRMGIRVGVMVRKREGGSLWRCCAESSGSATAAAKVSRTASETVRDVLFGLVKRIFSAGLFFLFFLWLMVKPSVKAVGKVLVADVVPFVRRNWYRFILRRRVRSSSIVRSPMGEKLATAAEVQKLGDEIRFLKSTIAQLRTQLQLPDAPTEDGPPTGPDSERPSTSKLGLLRVIVARHAKSTPERNTDKDHERPLNSAGKKGAHHLGDRLNELGWKPSQVLCSSAQRARETLSLMPIQGDSPVNAVFTDDLYFALDAPEMVNAVQKHVAPSTEVMNIKAQVLMIVCHSPGCGELLQWMTGKHAKMDPGCAALIEPIDELSSKPIEFRDSKECWKLTKLIEPR